MRFSWFKPINDTNVTRMMLDMNKELTIIMDNQSYKREQTLKINDKMYKVFTYQIEKPIFNFYENFSTEEFFDENGDYFIEYDFDKNDIEKNKELKTKFNNNILNLNYNNNISNNNNPNMINSLNYFNYIDKPKVFVDINEENMESVTPSHLYESNKKILLSKDSFKFHIAIYGLDDERFTNQELVEEIYQEIKAQSININKEDIQLIDEQSLLNDYLNKNENKNFNLNMIENIGRIALIRFKNDYDGLKFYSKKNYFSVPLNDGKKGKPKMILGQMLIDFIKKNQI